MLRAFGCTILLYLAGCSSAGDTSALLELSLAQNAPAPTAILTARVYDDAGALTPSRALPSSALPGRLVISHLPAVAQRIRVVVDGGAVLGVAVVQTKPGQQVSGLLVLGTAADSDGDGVPDSVDVCPNVVDPDQKDDDRDGRGNLCGGVILDLSTIVDFSGVDLAGVDMATPITPCSLHPEYAFCDDFESGTLGHWQAMDNASITTNALDGMNSLLLTVAAGQTKADVITAAPFPALTAQFWGRVRMQIGGSVPGYYSVFEIYDASGTPGMVFGVNSGFLALDEYGFTADAHPVSSQPITVNTAYCVEWHIGGGEVKVFVDGNEVTAMTATGHQAFAPGKLDFTVGVTSAAAASFSGRFDDIAFDEIRIGCAP